MINFTIRGLQAILPIKCLLSIWNGVFLSRRKKNQQVLSDLASTTKGVNYIAELCLSTHTTDSKLRVCSFWTQASKTHLACIHFGDFAILTAVYIVPTVRASSYVPKILWCQQIKLNLGCFWFRIPFLPQFSTVFRRIW